MVCDACALAGDANDPVPPDCEPAGVRAAVAEERMAALEERGEAGGAVRENHKTLLRAFATLSDYIERTTHWREGGADRHDAKLALRDVGKALAARRGEKP